MVNIVQTRYGAWDLDNDPCPGCGDGDKVPVGMDFHCPVCDADWPAAGAEESV